MTITLDRVCRHPLAPVTDTSWLRCVPCDADFPHREDCATPSSAQCREQCMQRSAPAARGGQQ